MNLYKSLEKILEKIKEENANLTVGEFSTQLDKFFQDFTFNGTKIKILIKSYLIINKKENNLNLFCIWVKNRINISNDYYKTTPGNRIGDATYFKYINNDLVDSLPNENAYPVKCPYCGVKTPINYLATYCPKCKRPL